MPLLTGKKATARTPQIVTLIVDDSNSMQGLAQEGKSKAQVATESIRHLVITMQSHNLGTTGFRFLMNIAKFGDQVIPLAEAQKPEELDLTQLVFRGDSGWTVMAEALEWAHGAVEKALGVCRKLRSYDEAKSPPPLVVFFSDGENTGPAIETAAGKLRSITFKDGWIDVVACGIGMQQKHLQILQTIASKSEFAANIDPSRLEKFIAAVGATVMHDDKRRNLDDFISETQVLTPRVSEPPVSESPVLRPPVLEPPDSAAPSPLDNWDLHMARGRAAMSESRWDDAERAFATALTYVQNHRDHHLAETWTALAAVHTARGDWGSGLPYTNDSLALLSKLGPTTALGPGLEAAVGLAELLEIAGQEEDAKNLWRNVANAWESPAAQGLSAEKGKLAALGFRDLREDRLPAARAALEQVATSGGPGAIAALKGLARIAEETSGRTAAQPYLERLVEQTAARHGDRHPLSRRAIADLRSSYLMGGQTDKVRELERRFNAQ